MATPTTSPKSPLAVPPAERTRAHYAKRLAAIVMGVVIVRLAVLLLTPLDLFYDEAQYWYWSQELALGYFSKPPLIGWLIAASTAICGNSEGCVRSAAPLFHGITTMLVFGLASTLYAPRTAFFAALGYLFAIAVSASSLLISTDVPLLVFWVAGLWAFVHYTRAPSVKLAIGFGVAIAIGLNAKYAMIYFPLCALAYLTFTREVRPLLKRPDLWIGVGIGLLGFLPNLIWNIQHEFITFSHTGENISGGGLTFDPLSFLEFFGSQFAVAGPILFAALLFALFKRWRSDTPKADRLLLFFSLPILTLLGLQAFQSSANYNWAATAFPALIIVTTAILMDRTRWQWVRWNLITCSALAVIMLGGALAALTVRPDHPIIASTNLEDMFGWAEHADELSIRLDRLEPDTIVTVGRRYSAGFAYYLREREESLRAFRHDSSPARNHFEFTAPWGMPGPGERAVIISPGNISPLRGARLVGVVEADDGAAPFRSNSYLFLAVGPDE
ncbi:MAG: glycosyltransferase family 39 protein [Pseudomonadota bacterium]